MSLLSAPEETTVGGHDNVGELTLRELPNSASEIGVVDGVCRAIALRRLELITQGGLMVRHGDETLHFGERGGDAPVIAVHSPRFWRSLVGGGRLGAEEAYLRGDWTCNDLIGLLHLLATNLPALQGIESGPVRWLAPLRRVQNWLHRNTPHGSRRNIAAHYDLSNEFFALMLDKTMAYSAGMFASPETSLIDASIAKFDRICRKLELTPEDHLLEIGCGWGGLAIHAARHYGCRVTATTISQQQYDFAAQAIRRHGLGHRIELVAKDYRELHGRFDKLASVEMIEAVGERYLPNYFAQCSRLLKPQGMMLLQAITIEERSYEVYRRSRDFIQHYIFPGGFLPAVSAIGNFVRQASDLQITHLEDFGPHYATTLAHWRKRFWQRIGEVRDLGFDERFIRMWDYYLCYSQVGFEQRMTGVAQILLTKPQCRRESLLALTGN